MSAFGDNPCDHFSCVENVGGQCFGGGCRRNPVKEYDNESENESESEDNNR